MRYLGLVFCFTLVLVAIVMGTPLHDFANAPSALIVVGVGFGAVFFGHGIDGMVLLFKATFAEVAEGSAGRAAVVARAASQSFIGAGWVGFLIGVVQMLHNMDDVRAIGPPIAVALLTVFYGLLFTTFVWRPTEHRMEAQALSKS